MSVVSKNDFNRNPAKYLRIAESERVIINGDGQVFQLVQSINEKEYIQAINLLNVSIEKFADKK